MVSGGTGLVGKQLSKKLLEEGFNVTILSRSGRQLQNIKTCFWDTESGQIDKESLQQADYIIHLAGASIGEKRWSKRRKQEIADSRVKSASLLFDVFKENPGRLKAFVTASATGYYGSATSEKIFAETDLPSGDFLGKVCEEWEAAANPFEEAGIRTVKIRAGLVLAREGGIIGRLKPVVKSGLGAALGSGRQFMPWIHIDDLCEIYLRAIEDSTMAGAYNAVAPESVTNKQFLKSLAEVLRRPFWLPNIPSVILHLILGQMAVLLLTGSRVSSEKIEKAGYTFLYPTLESALKKILKPNR